MGVHIIKDIIIPVVIIYFLIRFLSLIGKKVFSPIFSIISSVFRKFTEGYSNIDDIDNIDYRN